MRPAQTRCRGLAAFLSLAFVACDPLSALIGSAGASIAIDKTMGGLNEAIGRLDRAVSEQRQNLKLDTLDLVSQVEADLDQAVHQAGLIASVIEGKTAADVSALLAQLTAAADRATQVVMAGTNDAIRSTLLEVQRTRVRPPERSHDRAGGR